MKRWIAAFAVIVCALARPLAAEPWKASVDANLTLTQNAYSDNWVGGEVGSLAWVFNSNSLAERQFNPKVNNRSTLKLFFGQTHNQDRETKTWGKPVKSTDRIDFETVFRFTLGGFVDPYASGRIESEFLDASDPANERLVNPVLFTESFGIAKVLTKVDKREWSMRLGGAFRESLDRKARDPVSGERANKTTNDGGILFVSDFTTPLSENKITVTSKLSVYKAFFFSEEDKFAGLPSANYWKAPDVNWENIMTANITKYLMVNLYVQLLYDKEVDLAGRFKQTLSLGLTYKWSR
jgi:hypothetical protein